LKFFGERDFKTRISRYFSRRMKARKILLLRRAPRHRKAQRQAHAQVHSPEACWDGRSALAHWQFRVWDLLKSAVLPIIKSTYGTHLLTQAYPEGSPTHPCYPTGHDSGYGVEPRVQHDQKETLSAIEKITAGVKAPLTVAAKFSASRRFRSGRKSSTLCVRNERRDATAVVGAAPRKQRAPRA
jgi:hypothetical protein